MQHTQTYLRLTPHSAGTGIVVAAALITAVVVAVIVVLIVKGSAAPASNPYMLQL